jgi:hypothetical protein
MALQKLVYGVGINDADYKVTIVEELEPVNGKRRQREVWRCPFYNTWKRMLERCYSDREKLRHPSYKNTICCEEWHTFSKFKKWMETQNWENKQLDKDLLVIGNNVYSPETCYFIDKSINVFLIENYRGDYLPGVSYIKNRNKCYASRIYTSGQKTSLGVYFTEIEAHRAWQAAKIEKFNNLIENELDSIVKNALLLHRDKILNDYINNLPTTNL